MFNLQGSEIIVILLLALVVLGPDKLPDAIRRFSQTYNELKKMGSGFQSELKSALDEPMREMRETADMVRDAADPNKVAARADGDGSTSGAPPEPAPPATAGDPDGGTTPASPLPGDPPLAEPPDEPPDEGARPVNQVAASNSSDALAASGEGARSDTQPDPDAPPAADAEPDPDAPPAADVQPDADAPPVAVARPEAEPSAGVEGAKPPADRPMFHSAAPRRVVPADDHPNGADGADGADEAGASPSSDNIPAAPESSDETATA